MALGRIFESFLVWTILKDAFGFLDPSFDVVVVFFIIGGWGGISVYRICHVWYDSDLNPIYEGDR